MKSSFQWMGIQVAQFGKKHNCSHDICQEIGSLFRNRTFNKQQYTDNYLNSDCTYKKETLLKNQSAESSKCQTKAKHDPC